jgi:hypothetical protein
LLFVCQSNIHVEFLIATVRRSHYPSFYHSTFGFLHFLFQPTIREDASSKTPQAAHRPPAQRQGSFSEGDDTLFYCAKNGGVMVLLSMKAFAPMGVAIMIRARAIAASSLSVLSSAS